MAPPAQRYHVEEIGDRIITVLSNLFLPEPHGLQVNKVIYGSIDHLPTPKIPDSILPVIFVDPQISESRFGDATTRLTTTHSYRIVFIRRFNTLEEVPRQKSKNLTLIANKLMDDFLLPPLVLSDGYQIIRSIVTRIEHKPPEDDIAFSTAAEVSAGAMVYDVTELGRRS